MGKKQSTKRALLVSAASLVLCVAMLVGTTFAWFTDSVSSGVNKIQAGNLNIDIENEAGESLSGKTLNFKNVNGGTDILWEPGATFKLDSFKIVNKGNLALKYTVNVNGVTGDAKLLEAIDFTVTDGTSTVDLSDWEGGILLPADKTSTSGNEKVGETGLITISGKMKEEAGNKYQGLSIDGISITVVATQYTYENDSFGKTYDENAAAEINVNAENIQDYLDGKYGSIDGMTLVLASGDYGKLYLGRATAYAGSNTQYYLDDEEKSAEEVKQAVDNVTSYAIRTYVRNMNNVTFKAAENAPVNIEGMVAFSGDMYEPNAPDGYSYDYIVGKELANGEHYHLVQKWNNIAFEDINFTSNVNITSSLEMTLIDGVTFDNCSFTANGIGEDNGQALRYYNENNNGRVKNLVVENCEFKNGYHGVYTFHVRNVSVTGCAFDTIGYNAVAVQNNSEKGTYNPGAVVITGNEFKNIQNRIIRFNNVGADAQITIQNNNATNSGLNEASSKEVIKAQSLADGITYNISGNSWGDNTVVGNNEFKEQ